MALSVDIRKRLGNFSLNVNFNTDNKSFALLGASGSGKSVTLQCIAGIIKPDEGHIELNGKIFFDSDKHINLPPQKRHIGYLFQQYALFPNMTVEQNIAAGVREKSRKREKAAQLLHLFQLHDVSSSRPAQLSGGQQQRTALARILASDPQLLLLDEPFSALDSYLKYQMELELKNTLTAFAGKSVWVSHDRGEVFRNCSHVCVIENGKSEPAVTTQSLFYNPQTLSSCVLSGCKNFSRIIAADSTHVKALDWGVILDVDREIPHDITQIGVRAHALVPFADQDGNVIRCKVERVIEDLFSTMIILSTPGGKTGYSLLCMEMSKEKWMVFDNHCEISLYIEPTDIMLL